MPSEVGKREKKSKISSNGLVIGGRLYILLFFIDLHWQHFGCCESIQNVRYLWTGHGQKVRGSNSWNITSVSCPLLNFLPQISLKNNFYEMK